MSDFLAALPERVLVLDGATGTNLQLAGLTADDFGGPDLEGCNELLNVTRPDVVADLHDSFLRVGCDGVETNTFGAFSTVLTEYGIPERAHELARAGADHHGDARRRAGVCRGEHVGRAGDSGRERRELRRQRRADADRPKR